MCKIELSFFWLFVRFLKNIVAVTHHKIFSPCQHRKDAVLLRKYGKSEPCYVQCVQK